MTSRLAPQLRALVSSSSGDGLLVKLLLLPAPTGEPPTSCPKDMQVDPIGFYKEGSYSCVRPVYRAEDWAKKAEEWIGKRTILDPKYDWEQNWIAWEKYLREAAK